MAYPVPENEIQKISGIIQSQDLIGSFRALSELYPGGVVFSTSFGLEDQAIYYLIYKGHANIQVFTLDTGRLFYETYSTWSQTLEKYKVPIAAYYPDTESIQKLVSEKGPNSFYESVENRKECCFIRKVEPLKRALKNKKLWITGIRAAQSPNRSNMDAIEWDETNQIIKYHPLLHWSNEELNAFIHDHNIIYNPLHDKGFVSIGCAPCTRAIKPGEDSRAGRWWWEDKTKKECGLHVHGENVKI